MIRRGEVEVVLGHPLDHVLGPVAVAVDRVEADQLEVDPPVADGRPQVVAEAVDLGHRRDEPGARGEVGHDVPRVQALRELAPVGEAGGGDLVPGDHVHVDDPRRHLRTVCVRKAETRATAPPGPVQVPRSVASDPAETGRSPLVAVAPVEHAG